MSIKAYILYDDDGTLIRLDHTTVGLVDIDICSFFCERRLVTCRNKEFDLIAAGIPLYRNR